jgi:hypothetical protein
VAMVETRIKEKNNKPWEFVKEKEQNKSRKRKKHSISLS